MNTTASMADTAPSIVQAIAALLIVIGLIFAVAWLLRRFAFGNFGANFGKGLTLRRARPEKTLRIAETLWLDARHRIVVVVDNATGRNLRRTLLLGPGQPMQLDAHSAPSGTAPAPLDLAHADAFRPKH